MNKGLLKAAVIRAFRTGIQTLLSMLTVGQAITDIDWLQAMSVTLVAMLISLLTAILTGLPEVGSDGQFIINTSGEEGVPPVMINLDKENIKLGDKLTFEVTEDTEG